MSKDFGPRFHNSQHTLISNLKKKPSQRERKRKPLSFMMYIMILVRYQEENPASSQNGDLREERAASWRDEPQESTALSHVPAMLKASRTPDFLHYNGTDSCPPSAGIS